MRLRLGRGPLAVGHTLSLELSGNYELNQPATAKIRVVLADDQTLVRSGIKALLSTVANVDVVGEACCLPELFEVLDTRASDVVITEVVLERTDMIAAMSDIRRRYPTLLVLVLSMNESMEVIKRAMTAGASGYLLKESSLAELSSSISQVVRMGCYLGPEIASRLRLSAAVPEAERLTERQIEVLKLIASGKSSKSIASDLGLSSKTVDVHRARIMERLRLYDIASLTCYAIRCGLIRP